MLGSNNKFLAWWINCSKIKICFVCMCALMLVCVYTCVHTHADQYDLSHLFKMLKSCLSTHTGQLTIKIKTESQQPIKQLAKTASFFSVPWAPDLSFPLLLRGHQWNFGKIFVRTIKTKASALKQLLLNRNFPSSLGCVGKEVLNWGGYYFH